MSIYESIVGRVYCTDPDYMAFTGRVVAKQVVEKIGITDDGYVIGRVRRYIEIGRSTPVKSANADAAIADAPWLDEAVPAPVAADRKPHPKTLMLIERMTELLRERPMTIRQMADATGESIPRIQNIIRDHGSAFVEIRRLEHGALFGLRGRTYGAPPMPARMQRIVDYLRANGPSTVAQICEAMDCSAFTFYHIRKSAPDALTVVGTGEIAANGLALQLWGVVGEHTK